jgi:hypothetical protein
LRTLRPEHSASTNFATRAFTNELNPFYVRGANISQSVILPNAVLLKPLVIPHPAAVPDWHGFYTVNMITKKNFMSTIKKNPNDLQTKEAKSTRPGSLEKAKETESREIENKKEKKVKGNPDEAAADAKPFDAKHNNMHDKR